MAKEKKPEEASKPQQGAKKEGGSKKEAAAKTPEGSKPEAGAKPPKASKKADARLRHHYKDRVVPALVKEFGYKNVMAVPRIEKVSVNMGLGEATSNAKIVDTGRSEEHTSE